MKNEIPSKIKDLTHSERVLIAKFRQLTVSEQKEVYKQLMQLYKNQ